MVSQKIRQQRLDTKRRRRSAMLSLIRISKDTAAIYINGKVLDGEKMGRRFVHYLTSYLAYYICCNRDSKGFFLIKGYRRHGAITRALRDCQVANFILPKPHYAIMFPVKK